MTRANAPRSDTTGANATGGNATRANEAGADEARAIEVGADEVGADESGADESGADESGADATGAIEAGADESGVNATRAIEAGAFESGANATRAIVIRTSGGFSVRLRPRPLAVGVACALVALVVAVFAIGGGDYPMSPAAVVRTLLGHGTPADTFIVEQVRLPRVLTALLAGGALALSGAAFQALARNPLGSPDLLGFTQGAAAGALTVIVVFGGGGFVLAGGAVAGGLVTGAVIYLLAWRDGLHGNRLILVGIGVYAILTGINGYLLTRANIPDAARAILWLTGTLDGRGWGDLAPLLAAMVVVVPVVLLGCARGLRILEMGDDAATALGVRVDAVRLALLAAAVLLSALAAAATGPVAFVALTSPQLAQRLTRDPGPNLLPSLCMGAALMVAADLAAQRLIPGHQLPVGVVTGVLGGAYLVGLLAARRRTGRL